MCVYSHYTTYTLYTNINIYQNNIFTFQITYLYLPIFQLSFKCLGTFWIVNRITTLNSTKYLRVFSLLERLTKKKVPYAYFECEVTANALSSDYIIIIMYYIIIWCNHIHILIYIYMCNSTIICIKSSDSCTFCSLCKI